MSGSRKAITMPAIDTNNEIMPPLDFSFTRLENVIEAKEPRPPPKKYKITKKEDDLLSTKCVRLSNNSLKDISGLSNMLSAYLEKPLEVEWIDLSFNELTKIDEVLLSFEKLQILYLHGNCISEFDQISVLAPLKHLKTLTLHGNPIEAKDNYKSELLTRLPQLKKLDFCLQTKADRSTANTWSKMQGTPKKKTINQEED